MSIGTVIYKYVFFIGRSDIMRFDYRIGTEATFKDWEQEGCEKAAAILAALDSDDDTKKHDVSSLKEKV